MVPRKTAGARLLQLLRVLGFRVNTEYTDRLPDMTKLTLLGASPLTGGGLRPKHCCHVGVAGRMNRLTKGVVRPSHHFMFHVLGFRL